MCLKTLFWASKIGINRYLSHLVHMDNWQMGWSSQYEIKGTNTILAFSSLASWKFQVHWEIVPLHNWTSTGEYPVWFPSWLWCHWPSFHLPIIFWEIVECSNDVIVRLSSLKHVNSIYWKSFKGVSLKYNTNGQVNVVPA